MPIWGHSGAKMGPNGGPHEVPMKLRGPKMRTRRSQARAKMAQDEGKMRPSRSGNDTIWEPRWRQVGAQMWGGAWLPMASLGLLGASLRNSGEYFGSGSSMQGGLVKSCWAPIRDHCKASLGLLGAFWGQLQSLVNWLRAAFGPLWWPWAPLSGIQRER